jgi:hypothetical protein
MPIWRGYIGIVEPLTEKVMSKLFETKAVENRFETFEGARGTCCRIRGIQSRTLESTDTTYGWEATEEVILPQNGFVHFEVVMSGASRSYTDKYIATPKGVFMVESGEVTYN